MKTISLLLIVAIFNLMACSSAKLVTSGRDQYDEINNKIEGKECTIRLTNGQEIVGENPEIKADSLSWTEGFYRTEGKKYRRVGAVERKSVPISLVKEIETVQYGTGTFAGLMIGTAAGFLLTEIICSGEIDEKCKLVNLLTVPAGALIGLVVGSSMGRTVTYRMEPTQE